MMDLSHGNRMLDLDSRRNELQSRLRDNHYAYTDLINKGTLKLKEVMIKADADINEENTMNSSTTNKEGKNMNFDTKNEG